MSVLLTVIVLLKPQQGHSQTGYVLWQDKEGSATVYLDEPKHVAYLIDGGKPGALLAPGTANKTVLQFLQDEHYEHLVVVCSHPHDDHSGGFKQMIDSDPDLLKFKTIHFIDSGYPEEESLYARFIRKYPLYPIKNVSRISAAGKNAFREISNEKDAVYIRNFEYVPQNRASAHGNSIICQIVLQKAGKRTVIVYLDDANTWLVAQWAAWAKEDFTRRRPTVIIAPHHCSDGTDIDPLLDPLISPISCVVTADIPNRYLHPGPIMFNKWVTALGVRSVHISGAEEQSIKIDESGLRPIDDDAVLRKIVGDVIIAQSTYFETVKDAKQKRVALANTKLAYAMAMSAPTRLPDIDQSESQKPLKAKQQAASTESPEMRSFLNNLRAWKVSKNANGKLFVHESESGGYLNNLLYTGERVNGKWRMSKATGEYIGETEIPSYVPIVFCTCD